MRERAVAEINLDNLIHNLGEIRKCINSDSKVMAIVKANAYGHGAVPVARCLEEHGVDMFGVAIPEEAIELRQNGILGDILVLGCLDKSMVCDIVKNNITQTMFRYEDAKIISDFAHMEGENSKIHIKIDTGMNRIGLKHSSDDLVREVLKMKKLPNIYIEGIFTHLATADFTDKIGVFDQIDKFQDVLLKLEAEGINFKYKHILNSAGAIDLGKQYSMDYVRAGITLYGLLPSNELINKSLNFKPIMTLKSRVSWITEINKGESVSYDATFTADKKTKVATISIGYADGYPRNISNKGRVLICGQYANVIGKICMDQMMVDITDITNVNIDDEVVLYGEQGGKRVPVDEVAKYVETINYEIVCAISHRVLRKYI